MCYDIFESMFININEDKTIYKHCLPSDRLSNPNVLWHLWNHVCPSLSRTCHWFASICIKPIPWVRAPVTLSWLCHCRGQSVLVLARVGSLAREINQWNQKVEGVTTQAIMMPTFSSLVALQVVITTTCSAASDDKVGIIITLSFQCRLESLEGLDWCWNCCQMNCIVTIWVNEGCHNMLMDKQSYVQ